MPTAQLKFHGSLNDFLKPGSRNAWISSTSSSPAAIKDAIEAAGVPHTEVRDISVNGHRVAFTYLLTPGDRAEVFPFLQISASPQRFVLDVHLGKLAKLLRLLGLDIVYQNRYSDKDIVALIKKEERIVLTRDVGLLKHKVIQWGYWLRSQIPVEQAKEVIRRFELKELMKPFTRCLECNGVLEKADKEKIMEQLLPDTAACFDEYYQCPGCKKVYWKGSHYERMIELVETLRQ